MRALPVALALGVMLPAHAGPAARELTLTGANALVESLLVASPYKLSEAARNSRIHYRLTFADARMSMPETGEQHVVAGDGDIGVDICAACGSETPPDETTLRRYRSANAWVESNNRDIQAFARYHGRGASVDQKMIHLRDAVRMQMDGPVDFRYYDSAATALRKRSGDCTEVALLLAAVARARGIPARVAFGIAYSSRFTGKSHVFSPHAWVQVWNGRRWRSYDAGLGRFDAGHIVLAVGDGNPEDLLPAMALIPGLRITEAYGISETASGATGEGH